MGFLQKSLLIAMLHLQINTPWGTKNKYLGGLQIKKNQRKLILHTVWYVSGAALKPCSQDPRANRQTLLPNLDTLLVL